MLKIKDIKKTYKTGDLVQVALNGVSLNLRDNEFVSILGPSGSGKTTLLNIIGGLDRYDSGDLIINNISTKKYKDRDWDAYRNHTIGFVFQSYNLIPHQTVLKNVELALTIGGISTKERKQRALKALDEVGLKEQAHKKPNQMSGGQMQRVAIARALVNNPDILLADEPTGALDTKTSIQVMELLKTVAKDRLVVMVTHNPELAMQYSNRIVKLQDGNIISDSNPFNPTDEVIKPVSKKIGKAHMSIFTALSLSFNNLLTKKGRTILTAFAGSIGIIGIALILSLSQGFQNYIDKIQEDTMTSYPLQIQSETTNVFGALLQTHIQSQQEVPEGKVREQMMISSMMNSVGSNDLKSLKKWLEENEKEFSNEVIKVTYSYSVSPRIYTRDVTDSIVQLNPNTLMSSFYSDSAMSLFTSVSASSSMGTFSEYPFEKLEENTELLAGRYPENVHEVILVLSQKDKIPDLLVYSLGLRDNKELKKLIQEVMSHEETTVHNEPNLYSYEDLMNVELRLVDVSSLYKYNPKYQTYEDMTSDEDYMNEVFDSSEELKIVGVAHNTSDSGLAGVIYSPDLVDYVISKARTSSLVRKQLSNKDVDVFSNTRFDAEKEKSGLDFNDMVSIDEEELKSAFKVNIDADDLKFENINEEKMVQVAMEKAKETAELITSAPNVTQLTTIFTGINGAVVQSNVASYEKTHVETVYDDPESDNPQVIGLKLKIVDTDINNIANGIDGSSYKEGLSQLISTMDPDNEQLGEMKMLLQLLSDDDYNNLSEASKIMFTDYFARIKQIPGYDSVNNNIDYSFNDTNNVSTYGSLIPMTSQQLLGIEMLNQEALEKTNVTINNFVNNFTTLIVAKGISEATMETMMPLMDSFEKLGDLFSKEDIMTVDTDAFARAFNFNMDEDELQRLMSSMMTSSNASYTNNLIGLGYQDKDEPTSISIYFKDFDGKSTFIERLNEYNNNKDEEDKIKYTDITGLLMSSVETIINSVTYVLIAFVSISLIVSSIMIAVITLISVMERTKEIGILRAMGASKKNVSSIFNAETFIIGLLSGGLGIGFTYAAIPVINKVIHSVTDNYDINAVLPTKYAIILILISVFLTIVAGIIPSRKASKQDPVIALRTE